MVAPTFVSVQLSYFVGSRWSLQNCDSKSKRTLASPVYSQTNNSIFVIFVRVLFGRGVGEPFFAKKVPPHLLFNLPNY